VACFLGLAAVLARHFGKLMATGIISSTAVRRGGQSE
jgi:hypothetical protein